MDVLEPAAGAEGVTGATGGQGATETSTMPEGVVEELAQLPAGGLVLTVGLPAEEGDCRTRTTMERFPAMVSNNSRFAVA